MVLEQQQQKEGQHYSGGVLRNNGKKTKIRSAKPQQPQQPPPPPPSMLHPQHRNSRHYKSSSVLNASSPTSANATIMDTASAPSNNKNNTHHQQQQNAALPVPMAFPRLANAWKSLISSAGGITSSAFSRSLKPAFVDAGDEVIYYSNAMINQTAAAAAKSSHPNGGGEAEAGDGRRRDKLLVDDGDEQCQEWETKNNKQRHGHEQGEVGRLNRSPSLARMESHHWHQWEEENEQRALSHDVDDEHFGACCPSSSSSHYFSHRQPTTLEQIRQLYKSVPNFSNFDDEDFMEEQRQQQYNDDYDDDGEEEMMNGGESGQHQQQWLAGKWRRGKSDWHGNNNNNNNRKQQQQPEDWERQQALFGKKFEERLGCLCPLPTAHSSSSASSKYHQLPPPLQQPQRKRILLAQHGANATNEDDDTAAAAAITSPPHASSSKLPPCSCGGTPTTGGESGGNSSTSISCSGASSLSSNGGGVNLSSRSVPIATTTNAANNKWRSGGGTVDGRPPSFPTIEKLNEQYEKCVRMPTIASKLVDTNSSSSSTSPHDSLASCSLGSSAGLFVSAGGGIKPKGNIGTAQQEQQQQPPRGSSTDGGGIGTQHNKGGTTKCSPTDSGYRSRGETPRNGGAIVGNGAALNGNGGGIGGGGRRPRPVSMLDIGGICSGSQNELLLGVNNKGKAAEMDRMKRRGQREKDVVATNNNQFPHSPTITATGQQQCCPFPRKYIWTEPTTPTTQSGIQKLPFCSADFAEAIERELGPICKKNKDMAETLADQLYHQFGMYLQQFRHELRRLSGVFVKLTARDIGTAVMLLFPPELAWHCLHAATNAMRRFCQNSTKATNGLAQQQQQQAKWSASSLSNCAALRYIHAGHFLRWMWDTRVAAIVDAKMTVFLAAIFDWLLCEFLELVKNDSQQHSIAHWTALLMPPDRLPTSPLPPIASSPILRALAQSRPITKCYHILGASRPPTSIELLNNMLHQVPLAKLVFSGEFPTLEAEIFPGANNFGTLTIDCRDERAMLALHYWLNKKREKGGGEGKEQQPKPVLNAGLEQWLRTATIFALHRHADRVQEMDIAQAARLLFTSPTFDCPPLCAQQLFLHSTAAASSFICPLTKSVLTGQQQQQIGHNNSGIPLPPAPSTTSLVASNNNIFPASSEFAGWTPLCWAIALENIQCVEEMLGRRPAASREVRQSELPLQICAQTGNLPICELLLSHGANPYKCAANANGNNNPVVPMNYSSSYSFSSSPIAIAVARCDLPMLRLFIGCCSALRRQSSLQLLLRKNEQQQQKDERTNAAGGEEEEEEGGGRGKRLNSIGETKLPLDALKFALLSDQEKRALVEALAMATETGRIRVQLLLTEAGVPWPNATCWLDTFKQLKDKREMGEGKEEENCHHGKEKWWKQLAQLLKAFEPGMARELMMAADITPQKQQIETMAELLFQVLSSTNNTLVNCTNNSSQNANNNQQQQQQQQLQHLAAHVLSIQFQQIQSGSLSQLEREFAAYFPAYAQQQQQQESNGGPPSQLLIDPKFVDSPDLSDIRFRFPDGQLVFAHRIVLVNASEQFKRMLRSPSGVVDVPNAKADTFRLLLEFVYGNAGKCVAQLVKSSAERQVELLELAGTFGLDKLLDIGQRAVGTALSVERFRAVYGYAKKMEQKAKEKKQQQQQQQTTSERPEAGGGGGNAATAGGVRTTDGTGTDQNNGTSTLLEECVRFAIGNLPELLAADDANSGGQQQQQQQWWSDLFARMEAQFQQAIREASKLL